MQSVTKQMIAALLGVLAISAVARAEETEPSREAAISLVDTCHAVVINRRVYPDLKVDTAVLLARAATSLDGDEYSIPAATQRKLVASSEEMKTIVLDETASEDNRATALKALVKAGPYVDTRISATETSRLRSEALRRQITSGMADIERLREGLRLWRSRSVR